LFAALGETESRGLPAVPTGKGLPNNVDQK